jgi:hypothetical protein
MSGILANWSEELEVVFFSRRNPIESINGEFSNKDSVAKSFEKVSNYISDIVMTLF